MKPLRSKTDRRGGFTLLEVLAATAMFAVIVGAVYSVFHGALRLRDTAFDQLEHDTTRDYVLELVRGDLASTLAPSGLLAGSMIGTKGSSEAVRTDRLELHTASGHIKVVEPWSDIQKVLYTLEEPEEPAEGTLNKRYDLVRTITRNLLPATTEEPQEERVLSDVESLQFAYYDGETWLESWDSTTQETVLPEAVRVQIRFVASEESGPAALPMEVVVPIDVRPRDDASTSGTATSASSSGGGGGGGGQGGSGGQDGGGAPSGGGQTPPGGGQGGGR